MAMGQLSRSDKSLLHIDTTSFATKVAGLFHARFLELRNRNFLQFTGRRANESEQHGSRLEYDMISNL
jgi:hypothetical protein